jgi:diaminohydroxyphosphoribosylaminopyrimidine deaminase/5-amino-6-(5-phosphoribosylamino)uracil reductase
VVTEKSNNGNYQSNVKVATLPFDTNGVQMEALMKCLYESNIQSLIVEGGARTLQAFINAGIWDEARVERNPRLFIREGVSAPRFVVDLDRIEEIGGNLITYYRNQK